MHTKASGICTRELAVISRSIYAPCMSTILAANIKTLRSRLGMNQAQFAERISAQQSYISKWERGMVPDGRHLAIMAGLAGMTYAQFESEPIPAASKDLTAGRITRVTDDDDTAEIISLDLSLSMGPGTLIEEFVEEEPVKMSLGFLQAITRTPSDRLRMVRGIGDSMEPTLRTGDRVIVDINERQLARSHGVYWINYLGTHGIKRLRASGPGRIMVMSDNPLIGDYEVEVADLRIEGRVIWFARDL